MPDFPFFLGSLSTPIRPPGKNASKNRRQKRNKKIEKERLRNSQQLAKANKAKADDDEGKKSKGENKSHPLWPNEGLGLSAHEIQVFLTLMKLYGICCIFALSLNFFRN